MSNKRGIIIVTILSIIALCLSVFAIVQIKGLLDKDTGDVQYVMYVGTNDKDTNKPVYQPDDAKKEAEEILLDHFGGYTIQEAAGGWKDDGKVYTEYTLVIYLSDTDEKSVHAAADDMIKKFDQSSILIQQNQTKTEFYDGK